MTTQLMLGDCLDKLKELEDNSVHSIVTDPPYGLSFMGKKWDYDVPSVEIWKECLRVLKPGGHLLSFSSARTYHRMTVNVEDAGFEIRDQIMWVYGSGFPKNHNLGDGWGTALKPAHEPIVLARKPVKGTVKANKAEHGTGGLNIDASRVKSDDNPMKWETPRGGIWKTDSEATAACVENTDGRFPANFIHDGLDGETWSRYFYCAKASKKERGNGNNHPTVKPLALMTYLIKLVTPEGGLVLDPFMGSGSTGVSAIQNGFSFIGIEREADYLDIASNRIFNL